MEIVEIKEKTYKSLADYYDIPELDIMARANQFSKFIDENAKTSIWIIKEYPLLDLQRLDK